MGDRGIHILLRTPCNLFALTKMHVREGRDLGWMVRNFVFSRSGAGDHEQTLKFPCVSNVSFLLPPKRLARVPEKLL
jgi:hypothetical protein